MDYVALPKIELHAHLSGSVSRRTMHEIWLKKKAAGETILEDPLLVMPEDKHDYNITTFFPLFGSYIYNLLNDEEAVRYATTCVLTDFLNDGVVYLELRTTPRTTAKLTPAAYIAILQSTIADFEAAHPQMHTRLILSIDRGHSIETAYSILELAKSAQASSSSSTSDGLVVGLDLCGNPATRPNNEIAMFTPVFQAARQAELGITVHFGEADTDGLPAELDTLLSWQPGRLGHVIYEDQRMKEEIARRGLCIEMCLSSNIRSGVVSGGFEAHHFGDWRKVKGPKLSISTDDVGVFGSPLSNEYRLVAQHFHLDKAQICSLAREAIDHIFGNETEKQRLREIMWP